MTCKNCNAFLEPGARFCTNCGAPCEAEPSGVQSACQVPSQGTAQPYDTQPQGGYAPTGAHPYHELGGFLQFLAIMYSYISPVILALGAIVVLIRLIAIGYFNVRILANLGLTLINSGVCLWFSLRIGKQIRHREPAFLCTFQQMAIFSAICSTLISFVGQGFSGAFGTLFGSVLGLFLLNLYFVKSVRVRTYMGTDAYLKQSLFNRNTSAPAPADGSQNMSGF